MRCGEKNFSTVPIFRMAFVSESGRCSFFFDEKVMFTLNESMMVNEPSYFSTSPNIATNRLARCHFRLTIQHPTESTMSVLIKV